MISVAIDGPAGAGKSTVAKAVAKKLGYIYVDTGALYRTIALYFLENNVNIKSDNFNILDYLKQIKIKLTFENKIQKVFLFDEEVSNKIRTSEISNLASEISVIPEVRSFLLELQRNIAKTNNVIMDGRDIGTVVLPNATIKIYLDASPEMRAKRRFDEMKKEKMHLSYGDILNDIKKRDYNDIHRKIAPLKIADNATVIDTSGFSFKDSVYSVISLIEENKSYEKK